MSRLLLVLVLTPALAGALACAPVADYAGDRGRDLLDVVDLKGGRSMGLGVKAEATLWFGVGLGYATLGPTSEWYGRRRVDSPVDENGEPVPGVFLHGVLNGFDDYGSQGLFGLTLAEFMGGAERPSAALHSANPVGFNAIALENERDPRLLDRWRLGGEVVLPVVRGGIYLNLGQVADFVLGLATIDIGTDDGDELRDPAQPAPEPEAAPHDPPASAPPPAADDEATDATAAD